jgi:tRNA modification GTPase
MPAVDTIAAIATPPGKGGVCIVRVSGPHAGDIAVAITGKLPQPRYATFCHFRLNDEIIDEGLALYFPGPGSFTGEDVLELHGHGGVVVSDMILQAVLKAGARMARPGEFSERAYLNDKLDLIQAESVVDLIEAGSQQAARAAIRSLDGEFSAHISELLSELTGLRVYVESALDFSDEEIEFLQSGDIANKLEYLKEKIHQLTVSAERGCILSEGLQIVIAGKPNAGKSSLMNSLCGRDSAIVTDVPGTTRDVLREKVAIRGIPVHLHDTAGLRDQAEPVEQEGIKRAKNHIATADLVLWIHDDTTGFEPGDVDFLPHDKLLIICNKIDLSGNPAGETNMDCCDALRVSVASGQGLEQLEQYIVAHTMKGAPTENEFTARRRHLYALQETENYLDNAITRLSEQFATGAGGELLAEELRLAQHSLGEITGVFTSDDLLGKIFSEFCIGK